MHSPPAGEKSWGHSAKPHAPLTSLQSPQWFYSQPTRPGAPQLAPAPNHRLLGARCLGPPVSMSRSVMDLCHQLGLPASPPHVTGGGHWKEVGLGRVRVTKCHPPRLLLLTGRRTF